MKKLWIIWLTFIFWILVFVIWHFQKENDIVSTTYSYQIDFDKSMNKDSVLANMKLYPQLDYETTWEEENQKMNILLNHNLKQDTELIVNIDSDAKTQDWENLPKTLSFQFKLDANPQVDFVSPQWEITDTNQNVTVNFSSPMVSLTNLDNQNECPMQISPKIDWKCVWITTNTFQFRPQNNFPKWANYSFFIPSWIENVSGNQTSSSKRFNIQTPDFKLLSSPNSLNKDDDLILVFNDDIDLDDFINNFSISDFDNSQLDIEYTEKETNIEWEYETLTNSISIFPQSWDWWYDKEYQINIDSDFSSQSFDIFGLSFL